jgi:hypothetical protein
MKLEGDRFVGILPQAAPSTPRVIYYLEAIDQAFESVRSEEFGPVVGECDDDPALGSFPGGRRRSSSGPPPRARPRSHRFRGGANRGNDRGDGSRVQHGRGNVVAMGPRLVTLSIGEPEERFRIRFELE